MLFVCLRACLPVCGVCLCGWLLVVCFVDVCVFVCVCVLRDVRCCLFVCLFVLLTDVAG